MTAKAGKMPTEKGCAGVNQSHNALVVWGDSVWVEEGIVWPAGKKWKGNWKVWKGSGMKERKLTKCGNSVKKRVVKWWKLLDQTAKAGRGVVVKVEKSFKMPLTTINQLFLEINVCWMMFISLKVQRKTRP